MGSILVHQTKEASSIPGLLEAIKEVKEHSEVQLDYSKTPAVAGELAGTALSILIAQPTQALLNAAALGALLWNVIDILRKAGKKLFITKELAIPLIACRAQDELGSDFSDSPESVRIWGPMEAEITDGPFVNCIEEYEEALGPIGYFMAISASKPNNRVKTTYYLLAAGGKLCGSWTTQTFSERVPDFLRPGARP